MKRYDAPLFDRSSREVMHDARSWESLVEGLRHLRLKDKQLIHVIVLASAQSVADALRARVHSGLDTISTHGDLTLMSYSKKVGKTNQRRLHGDFIIAKWHDPSTYVVVCCSEPAFVREALTPLFERIYSKVVRPFLSQTELRDLLRSVVKTAKPDVLRIQEMSAKKRLPSPRRRFESDRTWTDVDIEDAFTQARDRNVWFSSVRFEVRRKAGSDAGQWAGLHCRLSKYGDVSLDGKFDLVYQVIIPALSRVAVDRLRLFSNRGRASVPQQPGVKPLEIAYDRPLVKSPDDLRRLLESLRRLPKSTCSVLHGNPYLHVTLVDDVDLSSADVWVLSESNILIIPQLRASSGSLKRLVNHIFEHFGEGKIGEPKIA